MKPTVGRIVHYFDIRPKATPQSNGPHAAIVTAVDGDNTTLWVFFPAPGAPREIAGVPHDDEAKSGFYWVWPPREN